MWTDLASRAQPSTSLDRTLALALAAALATFAIAKIVFGYRDGLEISPATYYAATAIELFAAVLFVVRRHVLGALLTVAFFGIAIAYSLWSGIKACGCLGPVRLSSGEYRMIAATLGLLATLLVHRRLQQLTPVPVRSTS
jgi:hypothetical protein